MSSNKKEPVSEEFLKMFDALMIVESAADAKELVQNSELIENMDFHSESENADALDGNDSEQGESEEKESR
jgi:hypothetical protein